MLVVFVASRFVVYVINLDAVSNISSSFSPFGVASDVPVALLWMSLDMISFGKLNLQFCHVAVKQVP